MIIQSARLLASKGAQATADHVFRGEANEKIVVIQGSEQALFDMVDDAREWRRTYAIRHFKIAPRENPTRKQLLESVTDLALEFGFREEDTVIIGHVKRRHEDGASPFHLHVLVPEVNPVDGKVLGNSWDYARQEKVARVLEARWGHTVTQGAFNKMVVARLRAEGRHDDADLLIGDGLDVEAKPQAAYRTALVQEVKRMANIGLPDDPEERERLHRTLPELAEAVRTAHLLSDSPAAFAAALAEDGLRCVRGHTNGRWIVEVQDHSGNWHFCNALHRLLKQKVGETDTWMSGYEPPEEDNDVERENRKSSLGRRGVRRTLGRAGRTEAPEGDGQAGDDPRIRRCPGRRKRGEQVDEPARQPRSDGRRDGARQDRGTPRRAGSRAAHHEREVECDAPHSVSESSEGSGRESSSSHLAASAVASGRKAGERLRRLLAVAAIEQHYRREDSHKRLQTMLESVQEPIIPLSRDTPNRTVQCAEDERSVRERRRRFRALLLRRAYSLSDHLPVEAVANLRRVDVDPDGKFVLLTLNSGTRLLDTGDRVTVRGVSDDIAITEVVACCARRGWQCVEVSGDEAFRLAASRELLRQGIEVLDCPLSLEEQTELRAEADSHGFDWSALEAETVYAPTPPWTI